MATIVLAVKGPESDAAVRWVAQRARSDATVEVVSVAARGGRDAAQAVADRAAALLAELAPDAHVTARTAQGEVVDALLELSAQAHLLVVGSDRTRPIAAAFGATVPMRLSGRSERDLVVVPAEWMAGAPGPVVVGWNEEPGAHAVVDAAAREALATGSPLRIVHAWAPPLSVAGPDGTGLDRLLDSIEAHAAATLADVADSARKRHPGLEISTDVQLGSAAGGLGAASRGASLIVVGGHRESGIAQLVFGSTADALIRYSDRVPLLVVGSGGRDAEHATPPGSR